MKNFDKITNLEGLQGFIALEKLTLYGNDDGLTSINITNNMNLKELYFFGNYLNHLLVSAPLLETLVIENPAPYLQTLNVINCPMLNYLWCPNNSLSTLDVSNNHALEKLLVHNNNLTQLIFGNNPQLKILSNYNNNLFSMDLTSCTLLETVLCWNNNLTSINLTNCPQLINLTASDNDLSSLDLTQNTLLKVVGCVSNNLTFLDVSQNIVLEILVLTNNNITTLNLQNNPQLREIGCKNNNLTYLNLQNGSNSLLNGTVVYNQIAYPRFDATNNPNLRCIFVDDVANCQANWLTVDPTSHFVGTQTECNNFLSNQSFIKSEIIVSPNPTTSTINIDFGKKLELSTLTLTNVLGQTISSQTINNLDKTRLEINEPNGVYFLEIVNEKLERQVFKVVKQ